MDEGNEFLDFLREELRAGRYDMLVPVIDVALQIFYTPSSLHLSWKKSILARSMGCQLEKARRARSLLLREPI